MKHWYSRQLLASVVILMFTTAPGHARTMAYISNADSHEIYVLELHENDGSVEVVAKIPTIGRIMPMAVSPDRKYLYAGLRSDVNSVGSFAIDSTSGLLKPLGTAPLADDMAYLSTDRTGKYLFGASYGGNKFSVNAIAQDGSVEAKSASVIPTGKRAHCIVVDPTNKFLFVPCLGDDAIQQYKFDAANGEVSANTPPAVHAKKGAGPRHLVFRSNGQFAYSTNELDGTVDTFSLDAAGVLTLLQTDSVMPPEYKTAKPWVADLHLTQNNKFLYASERTSNTIAAFRVDEGSGRPTPIGNYPTEKQPRGFNIDPQGKYLLAVGEKSNGLSIYAINQDDGSLNKLSHLDVGKDPNWVEIITLPK